MIVNAYLKVAQKQWEYIKEKYVSYCKQFKAKVQSL